MRNRFNILINSCPTVGYRLEYEGYVVLNHPMLSRINLDIHLTVILEYRFSPVDQDCNEPTFAALDLRRIESSNSALSPSLRAVAGRYGRGVRGRGQ